MSKTKVWLWASEGKKELMNELEKYKGFCMQRMQHSQTSICQLTRKDMKLMTDKLSNER